MNFIQYLKSLIQGFNIKEAIQKLSALFTVSNPDLETTAIIIQSEYNQLKTQELEGVIGQEEAVLRFNRLNKKLLSLIQEVEENINLYDRYIDEHTNDILQDKLNGKKTILFLASNPEEADIELEKELEEISKKLTLVNKRSEFEFRAKMELRKKDFQRSILELDAEPKFIHFAGSGAYREKQYPDGLKLLANNYKAVSILEPALMTKVLSKFSSLECVFLNACNTTPLALELSKHLPYIVSMDHYVSDKLAISFATSFYEAIASGKDIEFAFDYSLDNLLLEGDFTKLEQQAPRLMKKGETVDYEWHGMSYEAWREVVYGGKEMQQAEAE